MNEEHNLATSTRQDRPLGKPACGRFAGQYPFDILLNVTFTHAVCFLSKHAGNEQG
jgi:hypothetical protein